MKIKLVSPSLCLPPHKVTHPEKLEQLTNDFRMNGWNCKLPCLIGYEEGEIVQLITGSHRWAAALESQIEIPVVIHTRAEVEDVWGNLEKWKALINED